MESVETRKVKASDLREYLIDVFNYNLFAYDVNTDENPSFRIDVTMNTMCVKVSINTSTPSSKPLDGNNEEFKQALENLPDELLKHLKFSHLYYHNFGCSVTFIHDYDLINDYEPIN